MHVNDDKLIVNQEKMKQDLLQTFNYLQKTGGVALDSKSKNSKAKSINISDIFDPMLVNDPYQESKTGLKQSSLSSSMRL